MSIISVEISRPGNFGLKTSATLELPATWAEFQDAKEKARITDDRVIFGYELCRSEHDWLTPHIDKSGNLLELNLLAARMEQHIKDRLDVFEAMVKIETRRGGGQPLPIPRLINLTFSVDNCHVAVDVVSDTTLGKFLFENDMLHDGDADSVQARIDAGRSVGDLYAAFGKEHRDNEGGVFTGSGCYVEFDGCINEVYVPGEMVYFDRTGAPVVLEISKGYFNDPAYDSDPKATMNLPGVYGNEIEKALGTVKAASTEEIGYTCVDCLIPSAKEWINTARNFEQVQEFAKSLDHMERHGGVAEYKALLEASRCDNLDEALSLTEGVEEYRLVTECPGPEDYALDMLAKPPFSELGVDISKHVNLYALGKELMEHNNIAETSYGLLSRKDGGPLFSEGNQPGIGMGMR